MPPSSNPPSTAANDKPPTTGGPAQGAVGRRTFRKILVANRGEIAVRVLRACRELGKIGVAVFSEVDRSALHVRMAEEAYSIGPAPAKDSYLHVGRIIEVAAAAGVDAIHPGYGFLSENAGFAEACAKANIAFIGPSASAIRTMGDKTAARATVMAANVPTVPGRQGTNGGGLENPAAALAAAQAIGFPVLIKASAGGGGKGMRRVDRPEALAAAFEGAQREAKAAFGDDAIYVEKVIEGARHIEIQVFADQYGHTVSLGERDCSIQRRHQKVVEEAPSPVVSDTLRRQMGATAVAAARACGYVGAGTIEFLLDRSGAFYFLEMNTRLQVEHPITEMVTGLDLVALQIRVAEGEPLPQGLAEVRPNGVALEFRIYAEDPIRFLPSPGLLTEFSAPHGPYLRNDVGVVTGQSVTPYYDPLVAKLVVWGEDRKAALGRARAALAAYRISGIRHNIPFHLRLLDHPEFVAGRYDTAFIDRERALLTSPPPAPSGNDETFRMAALVTAVHTAKRAQIELRSEPRSAWAQGAASPPRATLVKQEP